MRSSRTCSHCGRMNAIRPGDKCYCLNCGHRGDVARMQCDCPRCRNSVQLTSVKCADQAAGLIRATGRGLRSPVITVSVDGKGCVVRIDSEEWPEFWVEVALPVRALSRLLDATALAAVELVMDACGDDDDEPNPRHDRGAGGAQKGLKK